MKKILIVLLMAFSIAKANAATVDSTKKEIREERKSEKITLRKLKGNEVSYFSKQNFQTDFANAANIEWSRDNYFDIASFTSKNKSFKAFYDYDGTLVGTTSQSTFNNLPASAQKYINKHYRDYKVQNVIFYDDNEENSTDMIMYNTQFEDSDSYFVELSNGTNNIILHVLTSGEVFLFKRLS